MDIQLPERLTDSHKGTYGKVAVFGGSMGMAGSVCLAATAALRSGAGVSYAVVPKEILEICQIKLTEVMVMCDSEASALFDMADVLVVGPGYRSKTGLSHIMEIAQHTDKPMVVDAEGLNYIKNNSFINKNCVVTPHPGEFAHMLSITRDEVNQNRVDLARKYAADSGFVVLLKGKNTVIASPTGEFVLNETGGTGLSTAGSGDVLAGLIGGFMAQGMLPYNAAVAGAYIHGLAGELAEEQCSPYSVMATDVLNNIGKAILRNGTKQL